LDSVAVIDKISATIKSMNETVTTIAAAVIEQGAATDEIARNISEAAQGTKEVSMSISTVNDAAGGAQKAADELLASSASLASQAKELRGAADRFMNAIRAA
jgi:methyl-accepting chemotaxis protein